MPTSVSVFWTSDVTPSVTSWSSASTSFVSRLMIDAGAVALVEAERQPLQVAEEVVAQVGEHPLAGPAGEVRLRVREHDRRARRRRRTRRRASRASRRVAVLDLVDRAADEVRRRERDRRRAEQREDRERRARLVRAGEAVERREAPLRACAHDQSSTSRAAPPRIRCAAGLVDPHADLLRRTRGRAARARRSRGRRRSSRAARRGPARDDASVVEHDDLVGERDRREAVGDDDRRPAAHRLAQAVADLRLGRRVDRGRRVVEDQDARVDDQRAGDRDPLALAAGERDPALADHRVVAVRQRLDELVRLREPRGALDLLVGRFGPAERDVLAHGRREEERVLRDHADLAPQRRRA